MLTRSDVITAPPSVSALAFGLGKLDPKARPFESQSYSFYDKITLRDTITATATPDNIRRGSRSEFKPYNVGSV
jgi:hypothetical protein